MGSLLVLGLIFGAWFLLDKIENNKLKKTNCKILMENFNAKRDGVEDGKKLFRMIGELKLHDVMQITVNQDNVTISVTVWKKKPDLMW